MTTGTPGRLLLTGYAVAQFFLSILMIVLFVLWAVGGVLVVVWVGLGILAAVLPVTRWVANLHRTMAGRTLGTPLPPPYRPLPPGGFFVKARTVLADPMTWRDLGWLLVAPVVGITVSLVVIVLLLGIVTGFIWWFVTPPLMQARAMFDRWFLCYSRTETLEQRVQVLTETRADAGRPLGRRAAPARARPARRRAGPAGRAVDEPRHGRRGVRQRGPGAGPAPDQGRPLDDRGSDRRPALRGPRHPPAGARRPRPRRRRRGARHRHGDPGDGRRPPPRAAAGAGRVGASTSASPSASPTSASTPAPATAGSGSSTRTACCARSWATTAVGGADPGAGTGMLGVMRRLAAFDGTTQRLEPGRRPDHRHPGGSVRLVLAEDHALLRAGLIQLLEGNGFTILHAVDNAPALEAALLDPAAEAAVLDVRLPPTQTDEGLRAAIAVRAARPGFPVMVPVAVRRAALRPRAAGQRRGRRRLPAQGPGLRRRGVRRRRTTRRRGRHRPRPRGGRHRDGPPARRAARAAHARASARCSG